VVYEVGRALADFSTCCTACGRVEAPFSMILSGDGHKKLDFRSRSCIVGDRSSKLTRNVECIFDSDFVTIHP
jgi:hypothetical protein